MDRRIAVSGVLLLFAVMLLSPMSPQVFASKSKQLQASATASSPLFPGQTVQISATIQFTNGTAVGNKATFTGSRIFYPNGTAVTLSTTPTVTAAELVRWSYNIPANAPNGLYSVTIHAIVGPNATWAQTSFTVNNQIGSASGLAAITAQLNTINSQIGSLGTQLGTMSSDIKGNFTSTLTAISGSYSSLQTQIGALTSDMSGNFTSLSTALGTISASFEGLATASSISDLKSSVANDISGINTMFGSVATSSQANAINSGIQSLQTQVTSISNIEMYLLLPLVIITIALIVIILVRRR